MRALPILLVFTLVVAACDSGETKDFEDDAALPPAGFTRTDAQGLVISEDEDDWRISPLFLGKARVDPAFPNPVPSGVVIVPVSVLEFDGVRGGLVLRARDSSGRLRLLDDIPDAASPGAYTFQFPSSILARTGLVRLFVLDSVGELVSYGDLMIE